MSKLVAWMDQHWYPQFARNWDDNIFRERILKHIKPGCRVLDYGAGRGKLAQMNFRGMAGFVAGIDVDKAVFENPYLDEAKLLDLSTNRIPFDDNSFDLVFADNVMEHVPDPALSFREIRRVLKPGGVFLAKTPNKWHYVPTLARMTPHGFHRFYNKLRSRAEDDTFPTLYRCNTRSSVRRLAAETDFEILELGTVEGRPEYLRISAVTYPLGLIYERVVNGFGFLAGLRCVLVFELRRK
ncbi:MAG: class I SAM-dependent methyltransferase [Planctomycetes bacterium]|nr:class I SAM-dependent methyltransferase [Planctomycetota bacterium]